MPAISPLISFIAAFVADFDNTDDWYCKFDGANEVRVNIFIHFFCHRFLPNTLQVFWPMIRVCDCAKQSSRKSVRLYLKYKNSKYLPYRHKALWVPLYSLQNVSEGTNFAADQAKSYSFNKWIKSCSWQWYVADTPLPFGIGIRLSKKRLSSNFKF